MAPCVTRQRRASLSGGRLRPLLRKRLAGEPIRFTPINKPTRRGYRFEGALVWGIT